MSRYVQRFAILISALAIVAFLANRVRDFGQNNALSLLLRSGYSIAADPALFGRRIDAVELTATERTGAAIARLHGVSDLIFTNCTLESGFLGACLRSDDIRGLVFDRTHIPEVDLPALSRSRRLSRLSISRSVIDVAMLRAIGDCDGLVAITFFECDVIVPSFAILEGTHVTSIKLRGSNIHANQLRGLDQLSMLMRLDISRTHLHPKSWKYIARCSHLRELICDGTRLSFEDLENVLDLSLDTLSVAHTGLRLEDIEKVLERKRFLRLGIAVDEAERTAFSVLAARYTELEDRGEWW